MYSANLNDYFSHGGKILHVCIQSIQEYVPDTFGLATLPNRDGVVLVVFGVVGEAPLFGIGDGKRGTGGN